MTKKNPHIGTSFENWLDQEGIREEVTAAAKKLVQPGDLRVRLTFEPSDERLETKSTKKRE